MDLEHRTLENAVLRLEPIAERHREPLQAICAADPDTWNNLYSFSMLPEHFDAQWTQLVNGRVAAPSQSYAVVQAGQVVGMTSFISIDLQNRTVEVGGTFYAREARGGPVNPAAKRLMFGHAFDSGMNRVQLCVDALNARSRAACLKLGAVQEGILRKQKIVWTGRVRDTVVFSITDDEWPKVRDGLDARLAGTA